MKTMIEKKNWQKPRKQTNKQKQKKKKKKKKRKKKEENPHPRKNKHLFWNKISIIVFQTIKDIF